MSPRKPKRALLIGYGRKSSNKDDANSYARQRSTVDSWVEANDAVLIDFVWEAGVSGKKDWKERGLGDVLRRVELGEASGVVMEEQSRLSRADSLQTAEVWDALQRIGARLVLVKDGLDTDTGDQELNFAIRAALAREQHKQYSRRMASVKALKLADGQPLGPVPVGYRRNKDGRVVLDPNTAPAIREAFERRARGDGMESLARFLDEAAPLAPKNGKRRAWSRQGVAVVLRNPIYRTGRLHYDGLPDSDWDSGAVVDAPLWHAVQRTPAPSRPRSPRWMLTGIAVCASCGYNLEPHASKPYGPGGKEYGYLRCKNRSCTAPRGASVLKLDRWVEEWLWIFGSQVRMPQDAPDLGPLVEAEETAQRRLDQVMTDEARDALGELWAADVKARRLALEDAQAALGEARIAAGESNGAEVIDVRERWPEMSTAERREWLGVYAIERIEVDGPKPTDWILMSR